MKQFKGQSFAEIYDHTANLTKKEKGDPFKLVRRLNSGLQKIWLYNDVPEKILEEPLIYEYETNRQRNKVLKISK